MEQRKCVPCDRNLLCCDWQVSHSSILGSDELCNYWFYKGVVEYCIKNSMQNKCSQLGYILSIFLVNVWSSRPRCFYKKGTHKKRWAVIIKYCTVGYQKRLNKVHKRVTTSEPNAWSVLEGLVFIDKCSAALADKWICFTWRNIQNISERHKIVSSVLLLLLRLQLSKFESQEIGIYVCWMVVCCSALLGKWQSILWYMEVRVVPLSPLRLAHTDIYCLLHWLCPRRLLLRCNGVSTAAPSANLLALLVIWMGSSIHSVDGDSKRRQPMRK